MKKLFLLFAMVIVGMTIQAQDKVQIFDEFLPKSQQAINVLTPTESLIIWNDIKYYPSKDAFIEAHPKGKYALSDIDEVLRVGNKIRKEIDAFMAGSVFKEYVQTDTDKEGIPILTKVYFDAKADKLVYLDKWRKENKGSLLDIARVYQDYGNYYNQ